MAGEGEFDWEVLLEEGDVQRLKRRNYPDGILTMDFSGGEKQRKSRVPWRLRA